MRTQLMLMQCVGILLLYGALSEAHAAVSPHDDSHGATQETALHFRAPWDFMIRSNAADVTGLLEQVAAVLEESPDASIEIIGHTWRRGGEVLNVRLSKRQALLFKDYIAQFNKMDAARIVAVGAGSAYPLDDAQPRESRNRRLELIIHHPDPKFLPTQRLQEPIMLHADAVQAISPCMQQQRAGLHRVSMQVFLSDIAEARYVLAKAHITAGSGKEHHPRSALTLPVVTFSYTHYTFQFGHGRNKLHPASIAPLQQLAFMLRQHPQATLELTGHSDSKGESARNLKLSKRRADTVKEVLQVAFGIAPARMQTTGLGHAKPIATNTTKEGRATNRRVEAVLSVPRPRISSGSTQLATPPKRKQPLAALALAGTAMERPLILPSLPGRHTASSSSMPSRLLEVNGELVLTGPNANKYHIEVMLKKCRLRLYRQLANGSRKLVKEYTVATARKGMDHPEGKGYVTKIDTNPWWYPTPDMKRRAAKRGKSLKPVAPGKKGNPMGSVKIHLSHGPTYRIHGTNRPDQIGRRVSLGCIRMLNKDGLELAKLIDVGTEVNVVF